MENFIKTIRPGKIDHPNGVNLMNVYCSIEYKDGRLSISGVEGPLSNGNCLGSCGQIEMSLKPEDFKEFARGWDKTKVAKFLEIWREWHLNDMQAGSPRQTEFLKKNPSLKNYSDALAALEKNGLSPDIEYQHEGKPYKYGHAWLKKEVPKDVLEWLKNLQNTDQKPAWV